MNERTSEWKKSKRKKAAATKLEMFLINMATATDNHHICMALCCERRVCAMPSCECVRALQMKRPNSIHSRTTVEARRGETTTGHERETEQIFDGYKWLEYLWPYGTDSEYVRLKVVYIN